MRMGRRHAHVPDARVYLTTSTLARKLTAASRPFEGETR